MPDILCIATAGLNQFRAWKSLGIAMVVSTYEKQTGVENRKGW